MRTLKWIVAGLLLVGFYYTSPVKKGFGKKKKRNDENNSVVVAQELNDFSTRLVETRFDRFIFGWKYCFNNKEMTDEFCCPFITDLEAFVKINKERQKGQKKFLFSFEFLAKVIELMKKTKVKKEEERFILNKGKKLLCELISQYKPNLDRYWKEFKQLEQGGKLCLVMKQCSLIYRRGLIYQRGSELDRVYYKDDGPVGKLYKGNYLVSLREYDDLSIALSWPWNWWP